ncbi:MAG: ATP-binding protein [Anditalea sp.]
MEVDDYKFIQVINNLISNSIKFTHDGGVISVHIEEKKDHVLFKVADDGIGIPGVFHDRLFEKFTQARRPGLKGEPSTGLGMSIIKTIVDWHEGKIWFTSKENEGTTFYIELSKD